MVWEYRGSQSLSQTPDFRPASTSRGSGRTGVSVKTRNGQQSTTLPVTCVYRSSRMEQRWRTEWQALSARIEGLLEAAKFLLLSVRTGEPDNYGMTNHLLDTGAHIVSDLNSFAGNFQSQLPG